MRKILYLLLLFPVAVIGQTATENYIKSTTYKKASTQVTVNVSDPADATVQVNYFDGLGRPIQQIAHKQSASGKDIVTHIEYDPIGRQKKEFLPFVATGSPSLNIKANEVMAFYATNNTSLTANPHFEVTDFPYSEKMFEPSPLNRVLRQSAPGDPWQMVPSGNDRTIKFDYQANEDDEVKLFKVTTSWNATQGLYTIALVDDGHYAKETLYKNITKDENWSSGDNHTTQEFKDKEGRVVLKRTFNEDEAHDTYYVYDDYGNLTYVIPPNVDTSSMDTSDAFLDGNCYQYKYDKRNRLVEKKLPGKQWEFIVYDKTDRVVASGPTFTPFGGTAEGWMFTKYDEFGRVCFTGWYPHTFTGTSRKTLQATFDGYSEIYNAMRTSGTIDGISIDYKSTQADIPSGLKLLTINYYDNYSYPDAPSGITTIESQSVATNVKGLLTGSWVRVPMASSVINAETSYTLYDEKARPIRTHKNNHKGGYTRTDSKLDFTGKALYTKTNHKLLSTSIEVATREDFTYTPQDKLSLHTHTIGSGTPQLIAYNRYDELGQLLNKQVGGTDTSTYVGYQKVDYRYNVRGWLTHINDVDTLQVGSDAEDLFAFKLSYENPGDNLGGQIDRLYNGNISETFWRSNTDNILRKYSYMYDDLNRLSHAFYQKPNLTIPLTTAYDEDLRYDKIGNITQLLRNGDSDSDDISYVLGIDDLYYDYDPDIPSRLLNVTDSTASPQGFSDGSNHANDYGYDNNGNMVTDLNKDITLIHYNHLNLPTKIEFGSGDKIYYFYNATGQKVSKEVVITATSATTTTDYQDGYQYTNNILNFFPHGEGYVNVTYCESCQEGSQYIYNYAFNYTDHLGNIRMSYGMDPATNVLKILEQTHYYPFGLKHTNYNSDRKNYDLREANTPLKIKGVPSGVSVPYKYKYNGKEYQDELGLNVYDYGMMIYDPAIGRRNNIDQKAEQSRRWSPYSYAMNNPVYFIDPDGMSATPPDWIVHQNSKGETAVTYHHGIETQAQATAAGYAGVTDTFKSGSISGTAPDGSSYSYSLNSNGTVSNSAGQTTNEGFATPNGTWVAENPIGRVNMAVNGAVNVVMGAVGFTGAAAYSAGTGGVGAALGGAAAMTLSTAEIGIGIGQIANSFQTNVDGDLQNFNTLPGLAAARSGNPNAGYIDAVGGFVPGMMSGGNFKGMLDAVQPNAAPSAILGGVDAYMDSKSLWDSANEPKK